MLDADEIEDYEQPSDFEESEPPAFLEEVQTIIFNLSRFTITNYFD